MKTSKQIEKHIKGIANHRRIDILFLIAKSRGVTVEDISKALDCNFKTISDHTVKLVSTGLVDKKYVNRMVSHSLSPYGEIFVDFLKKFQKL